MKIRPDIPIILCAGYIEQISEAKLRKMGISSFVEKTRLDTGNGEINPSFI